MFSHCTRRLISSVNCILFAFIANLAISFPLRALASERWSSITETIFDSTAQDADLPNAAVPTAFCEDGDGFLWIGSQNGLARWDGYSFRSYKSDPSKPGTLPDNYITALHTDGNGRLWIGTASGGLARYDRDQDRFVVYSAGPTGLSHVGVMAIAEDGANGIWVGTQGGLDHLAPQTGTIVPIRHNDSDPGSLPSDHISVLLRDHGGLLWIGTPKGLIRSDVRVHRFSPVPLLSPRSERAKSGVSKVTSLLEDSEGKIWVGTRHQGAYVVERGGSTARPVQQEGSRLQSEQIRTIAEARPGEIWLGTYDQGILAVSADTLLTRRIQHDPRLPDSLASDSVWALYRDRSGLMWVGTGRSISRHDPQQMAVSTIFGASSRPDSIRDESVHLVKAMADGSIWLGLGNNGVDIFGADGTHSGSFRPDAARPRTSLPKASVDAAAVSQSGEVYLGTGRGVYRIHHAGRAGSFARSVTRLHILPSDADTEIWALLLEGNVLWIGGNDGLRSLDLRAANGTLALPVGVRTLTDQRVTVIERGHPGHLWIGTENGLNRIDLKSHEIERILPDAVDSKGLLSGFVNTLLTDRQGRLWVGSVGGISVLVSRGIDGQPRFRRIGLADGLPNDNVEKLLQDTKGNIWASTDSGLAVIDPHNFAVRSLRRSAGVAISSYWVDAGAMTPDGELLFGGTGGLTVVRPDKLTSWAYRPPIAITNLVVGGKPVLASRYNRFGSTDALNIAAAANSLTVEFSALDYSAPDQYHYRYRLNGYNETWTDTDAAHRVAAYTNLPPGRYLLQIAGKNRDGLWTDKPLTLPIQVLPAWYQTIWFRLIAILAGLGLVVVLIQGRTRQLRSRQRELEQSIVERTAELEESRRKLERFAYFDFLTLLPNRRKFTDDFTRLLERMQRKPGSFALLLIDLDGFKRVNDTYGHNAGDALLVEVAIRLQAAVRACDSLARLGGDEFAILLEDAPDVERVCQRIFASFTSPVSFQGADLKVKLCVGAAIYPDHGMTQDGLTTAADQALYGAKRAGGAAFRMCFREAEADSPSLERRAT